MTTTTRTKPLVDRYKLHALELRGGNDAANDQITLSGFEAFIYSQPHQGHAQGGDLRFVSTSAMGQIVRFTLVDIAGHGEEAGEVAARLRPLILTNIKLPNPTRAPPPRNKSHA